MISWNMYDFVMLGMAQFLDVDWDSDEDFVESGRQGKNDFCLVNFLLERKQKLSLGWVRGRGERGLPIGRGAWQGGRGGGVLQADLEGGQGGRGGEGGSSAPLPEHRGDSQAAGPSVQCEGWVAEQAGRGRGAGQVLPVGRGGGLAAAAGGGGVAGEEPAPFGLGRGGQQGAGRGGGQRAGRGGGRGDGRGGGRGVRARNWVFTINHYRDFPKELPSGPPPVAYLCFGKEVSQNGTPHLQGYVSFKNAVYRPSRFFEQYGNGHFSMARGSADENAEYCAKEGQFTEFGIRPQSRADQGHHGALGGPMGARGARRRGEVEIERWEDAWRCAKEGRVEEIPADIRLRHYTTITKVAAKYKKTPARLARLDNTWIVGPPATGKSTYVHNMYPGAYKKGFTKWWCGFREDDEGHLTVLLDDLHPRWAEKDLLKNWADVFPFVAEYKGGSMQIRPARIVVTSNYTIEQVCSVLFLQTKDESLMNMLITTWKMMRSTVLM